MVTTKSKITRIISFHVVITFSKKPFTSCPYTLRGNTTKNAPAPPLFIHWQGAAWRIMNRTNEGRWNEGEKPSTADARKPSRKYPLPRSTHSMTD